MSSIIFITNSMEQSPSSEADSYSTSREIPAFGTRKFTRVRQWFLSWARWIQSTPSHPIFLRSVLVLFSHLPLGLPSGLLPYGLATKILYAFLISSMRYNVSMCSNCWTFWAVFPLQRAISEMFSFFFLILLTSRCQFSFCSCTFYPWTTSL
jgi:hypothetical protein